MKQVFKKLTNILLTVLLIPAVGCICCNNNAQASESHPQKSCCCDENSATSHSDCHSDSHQKANNSSKSSCCSGCFLKALPWEDALLIESVEKKSDKHSNDHAKELIPLSFVSLNLEQNSDCTVQSFHLFNYDIGPPLNIKSSPIQGRSPPLT